MPAAVGTGVVGTVGPNVGAAVGSGSTSAFSVKTAYTCAVRCSKTWPDKSKRESLVPVNETKEGVKPAGRLPMRHTTLEVAVSSRTKAPLQSNVYKAEPS